MAVDTSKIAEHMEVVGSDGLHVGIVDKIEGEHIKLTKNDAQAGGQHHTLLLSAVASVDSVVRLVMTADTAKEDWQYPIEEDKKPGAGH